MKLSREELNYMQAIMKCVDYDDIDREEFNHTVNHNKLQKKIEDMIYRMS